MVNGSNQNFLAINYGNQKLAIEIFHSFILMMGKLGNEKYLVIFNCQNWFDQKSSVPKKKGWHLDVSISPSGCIQMNANLMINTIFMCHIGFDKLGQCVSVYNFVEI